MRKDTELLKGLLADDATAWNQFKTRYDHLIYRCIHRVTSRFSGTVAPTDVQEIYSDSMVNLLRQDKRKLRAFDPGRGSQLGSWIGLIVTNTTYDYLRGLSRQSYIGPLYNEHEVADSAASPYDTLESRDQLRILERQLQGLSAKDRLFFSLYFIEELEVDAVAEMMSISTKTVYTKKFKIRAALAIR